MKTIVFSFIAILMLASCGANSDESGINLFTVEKSMTEPPALEEYAPKDAGGSTFDVISSLKSDGTFRLTGNMQTKTPSMVIRNANISMRVTDYIRSRSDLEKLVMSRNAYISNENEQRSEYSRSNDVVIRVSNQDFAQLASDLTALGAEVHSRNLTAEDVGKTYFDLATRLKTKKEVEARYIELLKRATTIKDILEIENNIRIIREEIEAKEGEMKYLADQTAWSTIQVHFYETLSGGTTPTDEPGFFSKLKDSVLSGWNGLQGFILGFVEAWPFWMIFAGSIWLGIRTTRKLIRKFRPAPSSQTPSSHA
ncbi:MAG: DUF4349 domain-containing protein [Bacteroidia bacterium]|nr:DUF4349 domain-containing protein [Bacteroidia bacterium]